MLRPRSHRRAALLSAAAALALSLAGHPAVAAEPPRARTISVDEVRPGMTGYGLTVFEGTRPERFDVKVVGVLHNFLPKQDLILVKSEDPRLVHSGIVAGMSGSPIYIDGRLAGALAYGWHFAKDPIAGVTPITNIQSEMRRPLRGREHTPVSLAQVDRSDPLFAPRKTVDAVLAEHKSARQPLYLDRDPLPPVPTDGPGGTLVRASVPLSIAGFGAEAFEQLKQSLSPYHMTPLAAGGTARPGARGPAKYEEGGSIAVNLVRGDVSASGTGTVTFIDGDRVGAFGHPMFGLGELYLPISTAEVHGFMSALSSSFKFSSPLVEHGSLVQDRQSCIVGDTAQKSDMIPVRVRIGGPGRTERTFDAEVVRHRFLTPMLASTVVANAAQEAASDVADATITLRTDIGVRNLGKLSLVDHTFSHDGVSARTFASANGMRAIGEILFNQFAPANLDRIDVQVDVDYRPDVAEIVGVSLHTDEIDPGSRPSLVVTLRPYNGPEYNETVALDVPQSLAGQTLKIEVASGSVVKPDVAPPENLRSLIDNLRKVYPARSIVVTVQTPDEGLMLRGSLVPELPGSVMDTLRPGASTRRGEAYKVSSRIVVPTRGVMIGKRELQVKVKDNLAR